MPLMLEIKVVPASGRQKWALDKAGSLKCWLKSPAEKGQANAELIKRIGKLVGVAQDQVSIMQGATSRKKVIKIDTPLTYEQFLALLGLQVPEQGEREVQQSLF